MTKIIITRGLLMVGLPLLILSSCKSNEPTMSEPGLYLVRVANLRADTISVVIGPADYGAIAPNDTTDYKEVNEGENTVWLDGQVFQGSPVEFGTGPIRCRWTYVFDPGSWGFGWDGCP